MRGAEDKIFNKSLEAHYLLNSLINTIDDKSFWEIHYNNLYKIKHDEIQITRENQRIRTDDTEEEEEEGEDEKQAEDEDEKQELDQYKIIEFLKLEKEIYNIQGESKNIYENLLSDLSKIEDGPDSIIPNVFNFKERLKLILCALCHYDENSLRVLFGEDDDNVTGLIQKGKELYSLIKTMKTPFISNNEDNTRSVDLESGPTEHRGGSEPQETTQDKYIALLEEYLVLIQNKLNEIKQRQKIFLKDLSSYVSPAVTSTMQTRSRAVESGRQSGGASMDANDENNYEALRNQLINQNFLIKGKRWEGKSEGEAKQRTLTEHIKNFRENYSYMDDDEDKSSRKNMLRDLKDIGFGNINIKDNTIITLLDRCLVAYFLEQKNEILSEFSTKVDELEKPGGVNGGSSRLIQLSNNIKEYIEGQKNKLKIYQDFIKSYWDRSGRKETGERGFAGVMAPENKEAFNSLYGPATNPTPVYKLLLVVNEDGHIDPSAVITDTNRDGQINDDAAKKISEEYIDSLMEFVLFKCLEQYIPKEITSKGRETKNIKIDFNPPADKKPLLRTFLFYGFQCIYNLANPDFSEDAAFWEYLEQNIGNDISISEEVHGGINFNLLVDTLTEDKHKNIAKFVYLLINMHYF